MGEAVESVIKKREGVIAGNKSSVRYLNGVLNPNSSYLEHEFVDGNGVRLLGNHAGQGDVQFQIFGSFSHLVGNFPIGKAVFSDVRLTTIDQIRILSECPRDR